MALKLGEAFVNIRVLGRDFTAQLAKAQAQFQGSIRTMESIAAKAKIGLLLGAGVGAVAVKMAASFEQAMARVQALSGATGQAFQDLEDQARELGRTTVFTANQAAEAMSFFALAGFEANKIIGAMPATLDLAAAGQIDVAQAADITAKIMSGMGLTVEELTETVDVLAKAFTTSNTDLIQLGDAMKFVGPVAKSAGKDITEVTAAIQVMSNAGLQGTLAGTALRNILAKLSGGTKTTNDVFKSLNVAMQTANGRMRPLADVVDDLNAAMAKLGEAERLGKLMTAFGMRAGPAMATLLSAGGDALRDYEKRLQDAGGTAKKIAEIQLDTFIGKWKLMISAISDAGIVIGNKLIPILGKVTEQIKGWAIALSDLSDKQISNAFHTAGMIAKWALFLIILPKIMSALVGIGSFLAAGGPWGLALIAAASAIALMGAAFIKSQASGEGYIETLEGMIATLLNLNRIEKQIAENREARRAKTEAQEAAVAITGAPPEKIVSTKNVAIAEKSLKEAEDNLKRAQAQRTAAEFLVGEAAQPTEGLANTIMEFLSLEAIFHGARKTRIKAARADANAVIADIKVAEASVAKAQRILDLARGVQPTIDHRERFTVARGELEQATRRRKEQIQATRAAKDAADSARAQAVAISEENVRFRKSEKKEDFFESTNRSLRERRAFDRAETLRQEFKAQERLSLAAVITKAKARRRLARFEREKVTAEAAARKHIGAGLRRRAAEAGIPPALIDALTGGGPRGGAAAALGATGRGILGGLMGAGRAAAGVPGGIAGRMAQERAVGDIAKSPVIGSIARGFMGTLNDIAVAGINTAAMMAGTLPGAVTEGIKAMQEAVEAPTRRAEFFGLADFAKTIQTRIGGIDDEARQKRRDLLIAAQDQVKLLEGAKGGVLKDQFEFLKKNLPLRLGP